MATDGPVIQLVAPYPGVAAWDTIIFEWWAGCS